MKKIFINASDFIKTYDNIFAIILFFLCIFGTILNVRITNGDELWDFQNTFKMYNGYKIYQDANVIVTPLFFEIGEKIFKILGANILSFRIYNIIIFVNLYFLTYVILKKIGIPKKISLIAVFAMILKEMVLIQANYNIMALEIYLFGVYVYLCKFKCNNIIQGIILFLIFMTKQNIGIFYAIGLILCEILKEQDAKCKIKDIFIEIIFFLYLSMSFFMYLYYNNILYDFINYTVLGIGEFAKENIFIDIKSVILVVFFSVINIIMTLFFIKKKGLNNKEKNQLIILNCFSFPIIMVMIPIINYAHFLIGIYLAVILFIYLIFILVRECEIKVNRTIINCVITILILFKCLYSVYNFFLWYEEISSVSYEFELEHPFYGGVCEKEMITNINVVTQYIKERTNKVVILSNKAALYMVPLRQSNRNVGFTFKRKFR